MAAGDYLKDRNRWNEESQSDDHFGAIVPVGYHDRVIYKLYRGKKILPLFFTAAAATLSHAFTSCLDRLVVASLNILVYS